MRRHYGKRRRAVLEDRAVVQDVTSGIRGWEGSGCESRGVAASITHRRTSTRVADVGPIIRVGKRVSGAF